MLDYSIIIPAYNEELYLGRTLHSVIGAVKDLPEQGEIIVVDNNSTDRTAQIANEFGVRVLFEPINQISRARNKGGFNAQGKYLIFIDADCLVYKELVCEALESLQSGGMSGGGALIQMAEELKPFYKGALGFVNWIASKFLLSPGGFLFTLKEAFDEIGGFDERVYASEEIWYSIKLKKWAKQRGLGFNLIKDKRFITSNRKIDKPASMMLQAVVGIVFPFTIYFKRLCWLWYPKKRGIKNVSETKNEQ